MPPTQQQHQQPKRKKQKLSRNNKGSDDDDDEDDSSYYSGAGRGGGGDAGSSSSGGGSDDGRHKSKSSYKTTRPEDLVLLDVNAGEGYDDDEDEDHGGGDGQGDHGGGGGYGEIDEEEEKMQMSAMFRVWNSEETQRYEYFRRSHLRRTTISNLVKSILPEKDTQSVTEEVTIAIGGATKIMIGELIELARVIVEEEYNTSDSKKQIEPRHLREAYRRLKALGKIPSRPIMISSSLLQ
jgi:transcription initiation factor TFIID subunit 11